MLGGDDVPARHGDFQASAQARPVHGGDNGLAAFAP